MENNNSPRNEINYNNNFIIQEMPILDNNLNPSGYYANNLGEIYIYDQNGKKELKSYWRLEAGKPRLYANLILNGTNQSHYSAPRLINRAFDFIQYPMDHYSGYDVDHINNHSEINYPENLAWITHKQNMSKYATEVRKCNSYSDELIHSICQDICNGLSRQQLKNKYHVLPQLIDDIKAGRSHKDISSQYVGKGFEYGNFNSRAYTDRAHLICKMIEEGNTDREIADKLAHLNVTPNMVYCIRTKRTCKQISSLYNF